MPHTPGPWTARNRFYIGIKDDPFSLASVNACKSVPADRVDEHEANARLIAAAPEMFDLLNVALANYDEESGSCVEIPARLVRELLHRITAFELRANDDPVPQTREGFIEQGGFK